MAERRVDMANVEPGSLAGAVLGEKVWGGCVFLLHRLWKNIRADASCNRQQECMRWRGLRPQIFQGALQSMRAFWVSTYLADVRTVTVAPEKAQARRGFAVAGNVCFVWGG